MSEDIRVYQSSKTEKVRVSKEVMSHTYITRLGHLHKFLIHLYLDLFKPHLNALQC